MSSSQAEQEQPSGPMTTTTLGSAPQRRKHLEGHVNHAYTIQRDAAIRGMIIWTFIGAGSCFFAHHLFPGFRKQTLALKGFLTSGATIFGLCTGAEDVLQTHEGYQRTEENLIRDRARAELGKKGILANELEIEKWRTDERDKLLRRLAEERSKSAAASGEADATAEESKGEAVPAPVQPTQES